MEPRMVRRVISASLLAGLGWQASADSPPRAPVDYKATSLNGRCYAFLDARQKRTTVFRLTKAGQPEPLWEMPGWFREASLSNDCEHLVIGFEGSNLLPLDFKPDLALLSFYECGKLLRVVKLNEVITDLRRLRRTVSHYSWGRFVGFDEKNQYLLETVEGVRIAFDVSTGKRMMSVK
jgi:hypothetical protein